VTTFSTLLSKAADSIDGCDVYGFALHLNDFRAVKLSGTAGNHREHVMDEPISFIADERQRENRLISSRYIRETAFDFRRQTIEARQLIDPSFQLQLDLSEALQLRKLRVAFQPQFELRSGQGCGMEALARWVRPTGEVIAPSVFIRLAERAGMIHSLGAWVLETGCASASSYCARNDQRTTLSVNVSPLQIDEDFSTVIDQALKRSGFPANQLELEITESALFANPAATIEHLKAWKQLGVRIAMDDFGTGYSSLSYLSILPVDRLKLDRSLIHRMTLDKKSAAVMRLVIALGAELDIDVLAEGVETEEQLQMLTDLGCPQVQGYLLGKPMSAEQAQTALGKPWGNRGSAPSPSIADCLKPMRAPVN
jgi:EAL domain-containing protein (putative c-di-GMP-specific phosphodiesterase class I)